MRAWPTRSRRCGRVRTGGVGWARRSPAAASPLRRGDCGDANGLTDFADRVVTVRPDVDEAQAVKTLAHELGHVLLHDPGCFAGALAAGCRGVVEVEAENFAYLLATSRGLDIGHYTFGYVTPGRRRRPGYRRRLPTGGARYRPASDRSYGR